MGFPNLQASSVLGCNQRRRFICLPHCVITLKLPRQAHGKFSSSTAAAAAAALCSETLSIISVFAPLVLRSPVPPTSAVWKPSTHPSLLCSAHIPGSRLEHCLTSREKTSRDRGGDKGPACGSYGVRDGDLYRTGAVTLLVLRADNCFIAATVCPFVHTFVCRYRMVRDMVP